jgi:tRNA threonylcarbamoyladenosine biosynthesis protein TsaE
MKPESGSLIIETSGPDESIEAGALLGRRLRGGEVIAMTGDLGAGKTTFIRGLARGLGIPEDEISSPTFVYVHEHRGRLPLAHIDLFRAGGADDLPGIGVLDYFTEPWTAAVEWAEKGAPYLPGDAITIRFGETGDPSRRRLEFNTARPDRETYFGPLRERFCVTRR